MTRTDQYKVNCECVRRFNSVLHEYCNTKYNSISVVNLRSCKARVYETENFYILQSYRIFVAAIDKRDNVCIDVLRLRYGYTATSAQHIAKFIHDYTPYPWNSPRYTWRQL